MDVNNSTSGLIDRIKALVTKPADTWPAIAAEPASPADLITKVAVPLAAIGPVAGFIHGQLWGYGALGFSYKPGLMAGLTGAVVGYVLGLIGVCVLALIADFLAPKFGGTSDRTNAFKLVVWGSTAAWIVGIFQLIPGLGILGLLALYSCYLFYTGAAPLMKVPQDKAAVYTVVTLVAAMVLYFVVAAVTAPVVALFGGGMAGSVTSSTDGGTLTLPGGGTIDTAGIEAASKQVEAAANGKKVAIEAAKLQALLPGSIGGYTRTATESQALGGMGSQAEGTYTQGEKSFRLKVVDMSGLGAIAGIGAAMGVEESKEDADGYSKTSTVNGQMQTEEWNKTDSRGKFGTMIATRFMVEAEGQAGSIDELKAAVAAVDPGALAGLAK
ncbi:Yip1 family protein [Novosphingobium sp. B 225]|uniref:Yip1 family protein n=1 Tax=Novosphingobium sp. B 225 TaxID=1961849 RepID=UPI0015951B54|nr:Yip1 family protein [Novosphingobium sp. B 225]